MRNPIRKGRDLCPLAMTMRMTLGKDRVLSNKVERVLSNKVATTGLVTPFEDGNNLLGQIYAA